MKKAVIFGSGLALLGVLAGVLFFYKTRPPKAVPWGPEQDGVRVRLVPLGDEFHVGEFRVGRPMPFRLEMKNVSEGVVSYDSQTVGYHDSFAVTNAAGAEVPFVGGSPQTTGGARPLEPGQEVVLVPHIDLAGDYLVTEPGAHRIQFRGQGPAFGAVRFPESNVIEVKVGSGKAPMTHKVAERLIKILPDDRWEVGLAGTEVYFLCNRTGLKADVYTISLLLEKEKLEGDRAAEYELLGTREGSFVYLSESPGGKEIDKEWADHRKVIAEAVEISER